MRASQDLREALATRNIRFAHWKSNSHLAEALAGETDLDLLIHRDDEAAFRNVMQSLRALPMTSPPWARYPAIEDWLILDAESGRFLHLHLHYDMLTGLKRVKHLRLPWTDDLLASVRPDPASGEVRAYDARTGRLAWSWDPVPQNPADPAYGEWRGALAHKTGGANAWSVLAADAERDLVFVPTGSAAPDYCG